MSEKKAEIRKEFAKELIEADMNQKQLEEYLQGDMSKSPLEFVEASSESSMDEYLGDKFPETKKAGKPEK